MRMRTIAIAATLAIGSVILAAEAPPKPVSDPTVPEPNKHHLARLRHTWEIDWLRSPVYGSIVDFPEGEYDPESLVTIRDLETGEIIEIKRNRLSARDEELIKHYRTGVITGDVVGILDGDTIRLVTPEKRSLRIRLHGIDAPEKAQPFCAKAKEHLSSLVFGESVLVHRAGQSFARTTGTIVGPEGENVNLQMIRDGFAWHSPKHWVGAEYDSAQREASAKKRGLWGGPRDQRVEPWNYRKDRPAGRKIRTLVPRFQALNVDLRREVGPRVESPFQGLMVDLRPTDLGKLFFVSNRPNGKWHTAECGRKGKNGRFWRANDGFAALNGKEPCKICNPDRLLNSPE